VDRSLLTAILGTALTYLIILRDIRKTWSFIQLINSLCMYVKSTKNKLLNTDIPLCSLFDLYTIITGIYTTKNTILDS
jgi:hypothetical protein